MKDGVYQAVFRSRCGEEHGVATILDGRILGQGPRVRFSGSLRTLRSCAQAILDVRVNGPATRCDGSTFGAAEQLALVLDGAPRGGMMALEGALPGMPDEDVSLEFHPFA